MLQKKCKKKIIIFFSLTLTTFFLKTKSDPFNFFQASSEIVTVPSSPVEQTLLVVLTVSPIKEN